MADMERPLLEPSRTFPPPAPPAHIPQTASAPGRYRNEDAEWALTHLRPMGFVDRLLGDAFERPKNLVCFSRKWSMDMLGPTLQNKLQAAAKEDSEKLADIVAQMIFLVPDVAGLLLDAMLVDVRAGSENSHLSLRGFFINDPMVSIYTDKDLEDEQRRRSANVGLTSADRRDCNVYEVSKQKCLLPNVLDLDIIQALAYTDKVSIFAKRSVQAVIYGGWNGFMELTLSIQVCLALLDVLVLGCWGLTTVDGTLFDRFVRYDTQHRYAYNSARDVPAAWNILAAGALRQIVDFVWKTFAFRKRFQIAHERSQRAGNYLKEVWGLKAYWRMVQNLDLPILFFKCLFLAWTSSDAHRQEMTGGEQAALCATFFLTVLDATLFGPVRVISSRTGLSVLAMRKASNNNEVLAFVFFFAMLFLVFILAWEIVDREQRFLAAVSLGFRGLVIGDGDGLDFLGLKADEDASANQEAHGFKMVAGIVGMVGFFSYLMNLLIAIFSSTYDQHRKSVWLHFHQARAQDMRESVLGLHKFRPNGFILKRLRDLGCSGLLSKDQMLLTGLVPLLLGLVVQCLLHVSSVGLLYDVLYVLAKIFIPFMTLGAIVVEAFPFMRTDWFPSLHVDGPLNPHYLWVFARKDFKESIALGDEEIDERFDSMERKMDEMAKKIDSILGALASQRGSHESS